MHHHFHKNIKLQTFFFHFDNKKCYLSTKSEWFLKDHVTLKTEVMAAENSASHHRNRFIFKYVKIENILLNCKVSQYYYFTVFDWINLDLVSIIYL